ncbi:hypothetical protein [Bifidobacterium platyrrhinorum]|nr:hypothetical protein [Bifidobacterium platyrrhinorum]
MLPKTINGVVYTTGPTPGSIHATGTVTDWGGVNQTIQLEAGEYSFAGTSSGDVKNLYAQAILPDGTTVNTSNGDQVSFTLTEPATVTLSVVARNGTTVDADITPILTKTK